MAMKFGMEGGSRLRCHPLDHLAPSNKHNHKLRQSYPIVTIKPFEQKGKGRMHLWLPHFTLMWSTLCALLLMVLWVGLNVESGLALGITDKGKTEKAKINCLWAAGSYSIGGIIAVIHIAIQNHWCRKRRNPSSHHHRQQVDHPQIQELPSSPPLLQPSRRIKRWTRTPEEQTRPKRRLIICVEGNIGSGKSTLINGLKKKGWNTFQEPVEGRWKAPLQAFYKDPSLWSFSFQITVLKWFKWLNDTALYIPQTTQSGRGMRDRGNSAYQSAQTLHPPLQERTIIIERSPWAAVHIFSRNLHANGLLTSKELQTLQEVATQWGWKPDVTLYVYTPWEETQERIRVRGRHCENNIPPKLLRQLENRHEDFVKWGPCGEVIRLDGSQSKDTVLQKATLALLEVGERHNSNH